MKVLSNGYPFFVGNEQETLVKKVDMLLRLQMAQSLWTDWISGNGYCDNVIRREFQVKKGCVDSTMLKRSEEKLQSDILR